MLKFTSYADNVEVWVDWTSTFAMLRFNPCEEIYGPWKRNEVQNHHTYIHYSNFPTCKGPWNWIWNLQDPTSIEFPDRKQIKEPYLQVFAFLLSEFTDKTWDLKRFGNLPLPEAHVTDWYELMPREIGNSVWPPEDQTHPQKSLAWNSVKYPWSLREMRCLPVKCGVYPWNAMFTRGKEQPHATSRI